MRVYACTRACKHERFSVLSLSVLNDATCVFESVLIT